MIEKSLYTFQELRANLTPAIHSILAGITDPRVGDPPQTLKRVQGPSKILPRNMGLAHRMSACFGDRVEGVQQSKG